MWLARLLILFSFIQYNQAFPSILDYSFDRERYFLNDNYRLLWSIQDYHVDFMIQAKTTGWVGVGFDPDDNSMKNADIIMGYVFNGTTLHLDDYNAIDGNALPVKDTDKKGTRDLELENGWESNGWTTITFRRKKDTSDQLDFVFNNHNVIKLIVAFGTKDDFSIHATTDRTTIDFIPYSSLPQFTDAKEYQPYNGIGNNKKNSKWGAVGDTFLRDSFADYDDGISKPSGADRPTPRTISNELFSRPNRLQHIQVSSMIIYFGQFMAHDITLSTDSKKAEDSYPIIIPANDPFFNPSNNETKNMSFTRTAWDPTTGTSDTNPRQQINMATAYMDASMVYGENEDRAKELRSYVDGKLKLDENGLLPSISNFSMACERLPSNCPMRAAGDVRANENSMLFSLHTIFVREHNRWCAVLKQFDSTWDDEKLYQEARRRVIAIWQKISLYEYLPAVLGKPPDLWKAYNESEHGQLSLEFAVAAFRYGHSEINSVINMYNEDMQESLGDSPLFRENLFDAINGLYNSSIEPGIRGTCRQRPGLVDTIMVSDTRNYMFGKPPGTLNGASDLAARSLQRGRETGIPTYNKVRESVGLEKATKWSDITSDEEVLEILPKLYSNVDTVDLYVGGLAEDKIGTSIVGPLYSKILEDGFKRLRDGDRFWFENGQFSDEELKEILDTRFSDVIRRNTNLGKAGIPDNVFFLDKRYTSFNLDASVFGTTDGFPTTKGYEFEEERIVMKNYKVLWSANSESIHFMLQVKTTGWIGIGFSPDQRGIMKGADMCIARVLSSSVEVLDYKATLNVGKPPEDTALGGANDIYDIEGWEENGWTIVTFKRKRNTGDKIGDHIINADNATYTIFAYQEDTDNFNYHGPNVAGVSIVFSNPPLEFDILPHTSTGSRMLSIVLSAIGMAFTLFCLIFQTIHRHKMRIKLSSPRVNLLLLFGCCLLFITIYLLGIDPVEICNEIPPNEDDSERISVKYQTNSTSPPAACDAAHAICRTRLWFITIGFSLVFGTMFAKTYRVYKVFNNPRLAKVRIQNMELIRIIMFYVFVDILILSIWQAVDPLNLNREYTVVEVTETTIEHMVREKCSSDSDVFWVILIAYKGIQLILGVFMSYNTRNVEIRELNDYMLVCFATYNIFLISVIVLPFLSLLRDQVNASFLLSITAIFICTFLTLGLLYIPKIYAIFKGLSDDVLKTNKTSMTTRHDSKSKIKTVPT